TPASGDQTAGLTVDTAGLKMALSSATGTSMKTQQLLSIGQGIATNPGGGNALPGDKPASPNTADSTGFMSLPAGANVFISGSSLDGTVVIGGAGGKADVRGLIIGAGVDMPVYPGLSIGGSLAYSDATSSLRVAPSTLQSDAIQGALYARYDFDEHLI